MNRGAIAVAMALLVVLAGCSGGQVGGDATPLDDGTDAASEDGADDADSGDGTGGSDGSTGAATESGTVNFYVSDRPNAIDDFEHLNVTVTSVRFHLTGTETEPSTNATETPENETETTEDANETATATPDNETATPSNATATATPSNATDANGTEDDDAATPSAEDGGDDEETETEVENETEDDDAESENETDADEESDEGDGQWVTRDVDDETVDLTVLRGDNATYLDGMNLPAGEYTAVVLEVGEINATLTGGESANVKLPSEKLRLNQRFAVANGSDVDFVYDVAVHKAGKSGKYVLRPVVQESGTDVPIKPVDRSGKPVDKGPGENGPDEKGADDGNSSHGPDSEKAGNAGGNGQGQAATGDDLNESRLDASFVGAVAAGEEATVRVTENGSAVENASVTVEGVMNGTTDAAGEFAFDVPGDAEEVEVTVTDGDGEVELERSIEDGEGAGDGRNGNEGGPGDGGNGDGGERGDGADD